MEKLNIDEYAESLDVSFNNHFNPGTSPNNYHVQAGDNLYRITQNYNEKYGTNWSVDDIAKASGIQNPSEINIGQEITFPKSGAAGDHGAAEISSTEASHIVQQTGAAGGYGAPKISSTAATPSAHTVQSGETLSSIVRGVNSKYGANVMSVEALAILNGIENVDNINVGMDLTLTANKEEVDECKTRINNWIGNMTDIKENLNNAINSLKENINVEGAPFDVSLKRVQYLVTNNIAEMCEDAEAFASWMQQLSNALSEETKYADTTIGNMGTNPISNI